ncbi:MAG: peptidoglycan endopeptidase [Deinococcus sp.]|nr:peptidoglycan endopeptidase [Deinococcus sp.]
MKALRTLLLSTVTLLATTASAATYTVKAGDTLYKIAQAHGMGAQQLMQANGLRSTTIEIGQRLQVNGQARSVGPTVTPAGAGSATVRTAASRFLGIPYRLGGTGRGSIDCSSYTQLVFRNMGISIPRTTGGQWNTGYAVSSRNLRAGDLVFFNTLGRGVSHVGIYLGNDQMANANSYYGRSMVERMFGNGYWASRYVGARRVM